MNWSIVKPMQKLTPTSYALLGLLCRQSWSAYELNKFMQYSMLRAVWPRTESGIYTEPKKLVEQGLAKCEQEINAGRKRSVYSITAEGRKALAEWASTPGATLRIEYETLLKLLMQAECNPEVDRKVLLAKIQEMREQAMEHLGATIAGCEAVLDDTFLLPPSALLNPITLRFFTEMFEARVRWVQFAEERLRDEAHPLTKEQAIEDYQEELARLKELQRKYA